MSSNEDYCAALVREADQDRYLATLFAPAEHRLALYALYAFAVEISRVRDLAREPMPGEIRLQWWREVLTGERSGEATGHPVASRLLRALTDYNLTTELLVDLVEAHRFDLYDEPMIGLADLEIYAERSEAALFALAAGILGGHNASTAVPIRHVGIAYAITGLLRAFAWHAARRQLYMPLDLLARHAVTREDIYAGQSGPPLHAALADLRTHARRHLTAAENSLPQAAPALLAALLPAALVGPTLYRMERSDYEPFRFVPASSLRRQWLLWRAARNPRRIFKA